MSTSNEGEAVGAGWVRWVLLGIVIATVVAFRAILVAPFGLLKPSEFEYWFFIPERDSGALSVLVATWLLWHRRAQIAASIGPGGGWLRWLASIAIGLGFFWSLWSGTPSLLIPILAAHLLLLAFAWGGRAGLQAVAMPCLALVLAFSPPSPFEAEIIWHLQRISASGAHLVLSLFGSSVRLEGTELLLHDNAFAIIEACSGWRGIQVLSVVALVASELRGLSVSRALGVVASAIPLGIALNIARVCLVVLTQQDLKAEFFENHTPQGIAVLLLGTVALYGIAARVEGQVRERPLHRADGARRTGALAPRSFASWTIFSLLLALTLCVISLVLPMLRVPREVPRPGKIDFPTELPPWTGTEIPINYFFPYSTVAPAQFHVEYRNPDAPGGLEIVDLFIAREYPNPAGLDRLPDSKLLVPAQDWNIDSRGSKRIWLLGVDGERAILSREDGSKFSYVVAWRIGDDGLLRESFETLLGLKDCKASHPDCFRTVLRISVPILHDDDRGREWATKTAENFVRDFKDSFLALSATPEGDADPASDLVASP